MPYAAIVLAAGDSVRMGQHKILLPYNGVTVIEHIVRQIQIAGISEIVVVTGRDPEGVRESLQTSSAGCVHNADYKNGMLTSVRTGLQSLSTDIEGAFMCLGDQPGLRAEGVTELRWSVEAHPDVIHVPTYQERRGHPLYIPRRFWLRVLNEFDDEGLRGLLRAESANIIHDQIDAPWVLQDIDHPEDYTRALRDLESDA